MTWQEPGSFGHCTPDGDGPAPRPGGVIVATFTDTCAVIVSRLLSAGLDLDLAVRAQRRDQATWRIQRAIGEVNTCIEELHRVMVEAASDERGDGRAKRSGDRTTTGDRRW